MNRNAIVMVADSAVTIGNHIAIHNSVNKLFSLSKIAPIGAIIYSNSSILNIPIEVIVKEYKAELGNKTFDTLEEYVDNFILHLENNAELYHFANNEVEHVELVFARLLQELFNKYDNYLNATVDDKTDASYLELIAKKVVDETVQFVKEQPRNTKNSFDEYIINHYRNRFEQIIINEQNLKWLNDSLRNQLLEVIGYLFDTDYESYLYSGIAIAGFGLKEIFPHMVHLHIDGIINGKARYRVIEKSDISETNGSAIIPLAQIDVMQTFLFGISDHFLSLLESKIPELIFDSVNSIEKDVFPEDKKNIICNELQSLSKKIVEYICLNLPGYYLAPIAKSIELLPIEELAMLAESLINITSVRRKCSLDQSAGTVGGPIDVSVITRGDGFIWRKRKHYFDSKYNPQFFYSHYHNGGYASDEK